MNFEKEQNQNLLLLYINGLGGAGKRNRTSDLLITNQLPSSQFGLLSHDHTQLGRQLLCMHFLEQNHLYSNRVWFSYGMTRYSDTKSI